MDHLAYRQYHTVRGHEPAGSGLECDKMSQAVRRSLQRLHGKLIAEAGPLAGKSIVAKHVDSGDRHADWTPRFREEFRRRRDMTSLDLPTITAGRSSRAVSVRFLWISA
jgi:hypothetical protein